MAYKAKAYVPVVGLLLIGATIIGCQKDEGKKGPRLRTGSQAKTTAAANATAAAAGTSARVSITDPKQMAAMRADANVSRVTVKGPNDIVCSTDADAAMPCFSVLAAIVDEKAEILKFENATYKQSDETTKLTPAPIANDSLTAEYTNKNSHAALTIPVLKTVLITTGKLQAAAVAKHSNLLVIKTDDDLGVHLDAELAKLAITPADHVLILTDVEKLNQLGDGNVRNMRLSLEDTVKVDITRGGQKLVEIKLVKSVAEVDAAIETEMKRAAGFVLPLIYELTGPQIANLEIETVKIDGTILDKAAYTVVHTAGQPSTRVILKDVSSIKKVDFKITVEGKVKPSADTTADDSNKPTV